MSSKSDTNYIIRYSKVLLVVGIVGLVFLAALFLLPRDGSEGLWVYAVFTIFLVMDIALILAYLNWRIVYNDNYFTVRNTLGVSKTYRFDQISGIRYGEDISVYLGEKKVMVDSVANNRAHFILFANNRYKHYHNGEIIPYEEPRFDIFNGNVDRGTLGLGVVFFIWLLTRVFLIYEIVLYDPCDPNARLDFIIIICIFAVFLMIYAVLSVIAGRNPQKYNALLPFLFKEGSIDPNLKNNQYMLEKYTRNVETPQFFVSRNGRSPHKEVLS